MISHKFKCCCGGEEFRKKTAFASFGNSPVVAVEGISGQSRSRSHHSKEINRLTLGLGIANLPKGSSARSDSGVESSSSTTNIRPVSSTSRSTLILGGHGIGDGSSHTTCGSEASDEPKSNGPMITKRTNKKLVRRIKRGRMRGGNRK